MNPVRAVLPLALHTVTITQTYAAWASHTGGSTTWTLLFTAGALITTVAAFLAHDDEQRRARARTAERRARPPDHMPAPDTRRLQTAIHEDRHA